MQIIVNCNDDKINIDDIEMDCKYPDQTLKILEKLFNRIINENYDLVPSEISLERIDEDKHFVIGEW